MNKYLLLVLFIICSIFLIRYYWKRLKFYKCSYLLPGPKALPIIGNLLWCTGNSEDILKNLQYLSKTYGTSFRFWLGPKFLIIVSKPNDLEILLNCTQKEESIMRFLRPFMGNGLITADPIIWKAHRKIINPTFNSKILNSFIPIFIEYTKILVGNLNEKVGNAEFDIFKYVSLNTLDFVCDTTMGLKMNTQKEHSIYAETLKRVLTTAFDRMIHIWYRIDSIFYQLPAGKKFLKNIKVVHNFANTVITKKKQQLNNIDNTKHRKAFLDHLLELNLNGNCFTESEIFDEINTFIAAGTDTISCAISFACMLLGSHPEIQEKLYLEINEVMPNNIEEITNEIISKLQYLERVLKETMRLFPPTPLLVRCLSKDVKLGSCVVPKSTTIVYTSMCTHRDPEIWPDPLKFDPDRFLPENVAKRHSYSYYPFGAGLRSCIGSRYAMISMKIVLALLVQNFIFKSNLNVESLRLETDIVLKPMLGYLVTLASRNT